MDSAYLLDAGPVSDPSKVIHRREVTLYDRNHLLLHVWYGSVDPYDKQRFCVVRHSVTSDSFSDLHGFASVALKQTHGELSTYVVGRV